MKERASLPLLSNLVASGLEDAAAHRDLRSSLFEGILDETPQPFAGFGSFRQRYGDVSDCGRLSRLAGERSGFSMEAPAELESGAVAQVGYLPNTLSSASDDSDKDTQFGSAPDDVETSSQLGPLDASSSALPVDIIPHRPGQTLPRLQEQHKGRCFSRDLDREEAWERKKELYLADDDDDEDIFGVDGEDDNDDGSVQHVYDGDDDDYHDCEDDECNRQCAYKLATGHRKKPGCPLPVKALQRTRTRSLTDEDLEELRGSIELGFGFSHDESSNLKSTLPALELYYAINRQYADAKGRGSPVSPLERNALARTSSADSNGNPSNEANWRISSPGDHPSRVKTRLRHWAQVVACSIKQGF